MRLGVELDPVRIVVIRHYGLFYSSPSRSPLFIRLAHSTKNHYGDVNTITPKEERIQTWD
jgi:hypothetical protein